MRRATRFHMLSGWAGVILLTVILLAGCSGPEAPPPEQKNPQSSGEAASGEPGDAVEAGDCLVARVGSDSVPLSDLLRHTRTREENLMPVPMKTREEVLYDLRYQTLDRIVLRHAMRQETERRGFTASDDEAEAWIRERDALANREKLAQMLPELEGLSDQEFVEQVRLNLAVGKLVEEEVMRDPEPITDADVKTYYDEHRETLRVPSRVDTFVLMINKEGRTGEEARKRIEEIRGMVAKELEGVDDFNQRQQIFSKHVRLYTEHEPTRENGGYWVIYNRGNLTGEGKDYSEFERVAYEQDLNVLGEIHEVPHAFFFCMVKEHQDQFLPPFDKVQETLRRKLMKEKMEKRQKDFIEELKSQYKIEVFKENILGCGKGQP